MMTKCFRCGIAHILGALMIFAGTAGGGASTISTFARQDTLTIGDRVELRIALVVARNARVIPPDTEAGFGIFSVRSWDSRRVDGDAADSIIFSYLITAWSVEPCSIPSLPFIVTGDAGSDTLFSDEIPMRIISVIMAQEGETITLKDIKPQLSAGKPSLLWIWLLLGLALLVIGFFTGRYYWEKNRKPPPPPPPKPPYEEAMEALAHLENKQLVSKGLLREYVFELSDILKRYIGRRFECNAAEYTTEELLAWLQTAPFDAALVPPMTWFFDYTHPIKFAKVVPEVVTVRRLYDETVSFVEKTRPTPADSRETRPPQEEKK